MVIWFFDYLTTLNQLQTVYLASHVLYRLMTVIMDWQRCERKRLWQIKVKLALCLMKHDAVTLCVRVELQLHAIVI